MDLTLDEACARERAATPKRARTRLARAEIWMHAARVLQSWADQVADRPGCGTLPFAEWGDDDPLRELAALYQLTPGDLSKAITAVAASVETRAEAGGYSDTWDRD